MPLDRPHADPQGSGNFHVLAGQAVTVDRWVQAKVGEAGDLRLTGGQPVDTGFLGEGGDGPQVGGFDWAVITGRGRGARVVAVLVAVGGVIW
ncbi:hypothetical protein [Streptomyces sp. NPDC101166]|uniref:hypothetical protein n=1 Tax=Streptomyces sp. NPDC101166 TaxID=3366120 RepID=UPI0038193FA0